MSNAAIFSKKWKYAKSEEAQAQLFTTDFLRVFRTDDPIKLGDFEYKVPLAGNRSGYIDYLWKGQIAIEMKSKGKDLTAAFEQLRNYLSHLPEDEIPDLWMVCDFENIRLSCRSRNEVYKFKTKDLYKNVKRFADLAGYNADRIREVQVEVNINASEKMAKLHDLLKSHGYDGHELRVYLVRLLFCLFADDTGIFPKNSLYNYLERSKPDGSDLSDMINKLFEVLDMPPDIRVKRTLISDELKQFCHVNGKLFKDNLPSAEFNAKMRQTLLECLDFDWNKISPAIFGAMFQGVMDAKQRREMGAHYTSEENILKLIKPLFLDDLWQEFHHVKTSPIALERFHEKISQLRFLDPACGCGNFIIITYRELRILEFEILSMKETYGQRIIDITSLLKVGVEQFYGIEYEDFPCQIAQVGMWLMDHQMNMKVYDRFSEYYTRLPLTRSATIIQGNALRLDWEKIISKNELSYILGNPPFVGWAFASDEQKADMSMIFPENKSLDYVCAWYKKSTDMMMNTKIRSAFVSTNSIAQGIQPNILWEPLFKQGVLINFGIPSFKWSNEAKGKAAVHCVIIGFSYVKTGPYINQYLIEAPTVLIEKRNEPLFNSPRATRGSDPVDGGNLIIDENEYAEFIKKEPLATKYIRSYMMGYELINNKKRYCLWLVDVPPSELRKMPYVKERIEKCRQARLTSKSIATRRAAETPALFSSNRQPEVDFIAIPKVSSERRQYIPISYLNKNIIAGDKLFTIPNAGLYHFGILTSNVHNAWMRAVAGRLKSDYSYSNTIVYNNFPWPDVTDNQKEKIEKLAQAVLDARKMYSDSSLADLYDPIAMPPDLLKAHQNLDRTVMKLYGITSRNTPEVSIVAKLMERYRNHVESQMA